MKSSVFGAAVPLAIACVPAMVRINRPSIVRFKSATTNQPGQQDPQVNSEGRLWHLTRADGKVIATIAPARDDLTSQKSGGLPLN